MKSSNLTRLFLSMALTASSWLAQCAELSDSRKQETAACRAHLEKVYAAIQEYRKVNQKLPDYFHDLVPRFISDTNLFLCPDGPRDTIEPRYPWLGDPKLPSHYLYEFSARECGVMWSGGKLKMADWKSLEMAVVGGIVPMVRCYVHDPVLSVSFDGKFYESPPAWEMEHADKVHIEDLIPSGLRLRLVRILEATDPQTLAFDRLDYAASKVNRLADELRSASKERKPHPELATLALAAADQAAQFQEEHPQSDKLSDAQSTRRTMIWTAAWAGDREARRRFDEMVESAKSPSLPESERLELRMLALFVDGLDGSDGALDEPARALIKEFPKERDVYWFFLGLARDSTDEPRRQSLVEEILKMAGAPDAVKREAKALGKNQTVIPETMTTNLMKPKPNASLIIATLGATLGLNLPLHAITWFPHNGHEYGLTDMANIWTQAETEAVGAGGHLVAINDAAEQAFLETTFGADQIFWLGLNDAATEGVFQWSNGDALTFSNWSLGEPNDYPNPGTPHEEDFAAMNWHHVMGGGVPPGGQWNDMPGSFTYYGIVERTQAVPDSGSTAALAAIGLIGLAAGRRRLPVS